MSDCDVTNLMMQPQEYCSCDVCGKANRKIVQPREKKCSFAESDCERKTSENSCSSSSGEESKCSERMKGPKTSNSSITSKESGEALCPPQEPFNCNDTYTPSGMNPPKTVGPLGKKFDCCSKYAPCGHWGNCTSEGHQHDKLFEACETCKIRAPFGPYGPWNKYGPSKFKINCSDYIARIYPKPPKCCPRLNGLNNKIEKNPMGKMRPWPLSGSCRYAGKPYGACRPFGAYRSRGPFGIWEVGGCDPEWIGRPKTPAQPCWKPIKPGYRPCTPCHRPLYRPCKEGYKKGPCNIKAMVVPRCERICNT